MKRLLSVQLVGVVLVTGLSFPHIAVVQQQQEVGGRPRSGHHQHFLAAAKHHNTRFWFRRKRSTARQSSNDPVHLQQHDNIDTPSSSKTTTNTNSTNNTIQVHTYRDGTSFKTYKALNTSKQKFQAYLTYTRGKPVAEQAISTTCERPEDPQHRVKQQWKRLWEQNRLITDRTEWLSRHSHQFPDLLHLYTERVWGFLAGDETYLEHWLETQYPGEWRTLLARNMKELGFQEQKTRLKRFLEWFRSEYPYFYDRCEHCGASKREEGSNDDPQTFVGYIHPNAAEAVGKAMRTELYQCHECDDFTRFPRYNSVRHVLSHKKGRCGEYSMLFFRILRFLGHDARWVVDWADHVWSEVYLKDEWIHLDPCEAAVDENLIYQNWGKRQVYIIAFWLPRPGERTLRHPLVEDVTQRYTTESWDSIHELREESEEQVQAAIETATRNLHEKLGIPMSQRNTTDAMAVAVVH